MDAEVFLHPIFTGKGEAIEAILAALQVVSEPFRSFANTLVDICAYAGQSGVGMGGWEIPVLFIPSLHSRNTQQPQVKI